MHDGGWVPLSIGFVHRLAKETSGRGYSSLEAAFSLQVDYFQENAVSINGYAALWKWSNGKVKRFLDGLGWKIEKSGSKLGRLTIKQPDKQTDNGNKAAGKRKYNGKIRAIDSKGLSHQAERKREESEQKTDNRQYTTSKIKEKEKIIWEEFDVSKRFKTK